MPMISTSFLRVLIVEILGACERERVREALPDAAKHVKGKGIAGGKDASLRVFK